MHSAVLRLGTHVLLTALVAVASVSAQHDEAWLRRVVAEGNVAVQSGDVDTAIARFDAAHAAFPHIDNLQRALGSAHGRRGVVRADRGDNDGAIADLERARELLPDNVSVLVNLALVRIRLDRLEEADEVLVRAKELAPDDPQVQRALGTLAEKRDDVIGAAEHFERASAGRPDDPRLRAAADRLRRYASVEKDFRRLRHGVFELQYPKGRSAGTEAALPVVRNWLNEALRDLRKDLGRMPTKPIPIVLYGEGQFQRVTSAKHWAIAYFDGKVRMDLTGWRSRQAELRGTLRHELAHACLHQFYPDLPPWVHEGYAQVIGEDSVAVARSILARGGTLEGERFYRGFAGSDDVGLVTRGYAQSLVVISELRAMRTSREFQRMLSLISSGTDSAAAVRTAYGIDLAEIVSDMGRAAATATLTRETDSELVAISA